MSADRITKKEANYREGNPDGEECDTCKMFRRELNQCTLVIGEIRADMVCDYWMRKRGS